MAGGLKIFLIGMMGSGKSYWAARLKKKYRITSYDLDALIEMMQEKTVAEIFEDDGEEYFRKEEAKMLRLFKEKKQFILSCGGGTPCFNGNMTWMNNNGITIWLNEPVEVLMVRLEKEKEHRPLISGKTNQELFSFLNNMLMERSAWYKRAAHQLQSEQLSEEGFKKIIDQYA